jgi:5-formyltetrahydrofolate cyclo-ligase
MSGLQALIMQGKISILLFYIYKSCEAAMTGWSSGIQKSAVADEKAEVRALMIERRGLIPPKRRQAMSEAIAGYVTALPEVVSARNIHLYLPIASHTEVSTEPLVDGLTNMEKLLTVPVVDGHDLVSAEYRKGVNLGTGKFGQPEPQVVIKADESQLDVVLLPLLAFDKRGYRIGYGKGFYDRFLQRLFREGIRPSRFGLAFTMQMIDALPLDPWDEPLDGVVHELGMIRFT